MLEWNPSYLTGIDEIDLQHKYFLMLINRIESRITSSGLSEGHNPLLAELVYYAQFHFLSEENIMAEAGYPDLADHKLLHTELIEQLNNEILMLESKMVEPLHIVKMLSDWFNDHTLIEDKKYAHFIAAS